MNILYLSWTGLAEPLGRSQVLAYLRHLSRDHRITVVSMEKRADLADARLIAEVRALCNEHGIAWRPLRYHQRPRMLARAADLATFWRVAAREARTIDADLVHARSYIATFVASRLGRPYIFDMRSLWPEELLVAGRLKQGSALHRAILAAERHMLLGAAGIVSLTQAAVDHLRARMPALAERDFAVIPTCADLDRFRPDPASRGRSGRIGTVGTVVSGWFWQDWLMAFFAAWRAHRPDDGLRIVTRDPPATLRANAAAAGIDPATIEIYPRKPAEVAAELHDLDALAMFFQTGISKLGSCPTRMAEALGSGLPVVTNGGVGDVEAIVRDNRVGVIVEANTLEAMARAAQQLEALLGDPALATRCRETAERLFSVTGGAQRYAALYERAAGRR